MGGRTWEYESYLMATRTVLDCIRQKGNAIVLELDSFVKVIDSFSQLLNFLETTSDVTRPNRS